jgi:hypothetical protein
MLDAVPSLMLLSIAILSRASPFSPLLNYRFLIISLIGAGIYIDGIWNGNGIVLLLETPIEDYRKNAAPPIIKY